MGQRQKSRSRPVALAATPSPPPRAPAGAPRALALPLLFAALLAGLAFVPAARDEPGVHWAFLGAAGALAAWNLTLWRRPSGTRRPTFQIVIRRPHWLQPLVQLTIYVYWSRTSPQVGQAVHLIAAQLAFAYAFDMLLVWSRRDTYELGFGPCPVILSMNLFLWFKPDWFWLQFVMVAVGFGAKEVFRWQRDGRRAHIFNPSSFPLAIVSVGLLLTAGTDLTAGNDIATSLGAPRHIYELLFFISLPGQFLFGVAVMTLPALVVAYGLSAAYFAWFGTYYFAGPVPLAVVLGMLLLFTDPATAPRTDLGRILYGMLYGLGVFVAFGLLEAAGERTFYDKLLPVPLLNLSVRALDRFASRPAMARLDPGRWLARIPQRGKHLVYMAVWALAFFGIRAVHGVGDVHPAHRLPFWQQACKEDRRHACRTVVNLEVTACGRGSGWACNELGILVAERAAGGRSELAERFPPQVSFRHACRLDFEAGCLNAAIAPGTATLVHRPPSLGDYELLLEAKALPRDPTPADLLEGACEQGWTDGCMSLGYLFAASALVPHDAARAAVGFEQACHGGNAEGCAVIGRMYRDGEGVVVDPVRATWFRDRACRLGLASSCRPVP